MKLNCWQYNHCGREPHGSRAGDLGVCPAALESRLDGVHGGVNGGRACWAVAGSLCHVGENGASFDHQAICRQCTFRSSVRRREGATFLDLEQLRAHLVAASPPGTEEPYLWPRTLMESRGRTSDPGTSFDAAARMISGLCKEQVGARAGYVALLSQDGTRNEVVFLDSGGLACSVDPSLPMHIRGLREEAYRSGCALWKNDFPRSKWAENLPEGHAVLDSVLFAPILVDGKACGTIGLGNKSGGFDKKDARVAEAFAAVAALALRHLWERRRLCLADDVAHEVLESAGVLAATLDSKGRIEGLNEVIRQLTGLPASSTHGKDWREALLAESIEPGLGQPDDLDRAHPPAAFTAPLVTASGDERMISWRKLNLGSHGELARTVLIGLDATERVRAEQQVVESERWLRRSQRVARVGSYIFDIAHGTWTSSDVLDDIFGIEPDYERSVEGWASLVHPEHREEMLAYLGDHVIRGHHTFDRQYRIIRPADRAERWVHDKGELELDAQGDPVVMFGTIADITEYKRMDAQLERSRLKLRRLASELATSEERARREAAADLHDNVAQPMAIAKMRLLSARKASRSTRVREDLDVALRGVEEAVSAARALAREICPPALERLGLRVALEDLVRAHEAVHGMSCSLMAEEGSEPDDVKMMHLLFKVTRELLVNAARHSGASAVGVSLARGDADLRLEVEDNGVGFAPGVLEDCSAGSGFGLFGIQQRLATVGGNLSLESRAEGGARVVVHVPLAEHLPEPS